LARSISWLASPCRVPLRHARAERGDRFYQLIRRLPSRVMLRYDRRRHYAGYRSMTTQFLLNRVGEPRATLILAHGSGQPMDSPFMTRVAALIAGGDAFVVEVARFNFPYMERA